MKKIAIYLNQLNASQVCYEAISQVNKLLAKSRDYDVTIFYNNLGMSFIQANCAVMHAQAAWKFGETIICTNVTDALAVAKLPAPKRKILLAYDLEWQGHESKPYKACCEAYRNSGMELWARSEDHAKALAGAFNTKVAGILPNFNLEEIYATHL